jgi:serine/threonine-protein kinase
MPEVGETVDARDRLEEIVAQGGMGLIMRARQLAMDRDVAVKLLHPHMASDEETVARFEREVNLAKLLDHPHTIELYDFGKTDGGSLYIVMEHLEGRDLREVVKDEGPLPV